MKHLFTLLCLSLVLSNLTLGQSQIISITQEPISPTDTDTIYVYANLQFPSSDCPLDFKEHSVAGDIIFAQSHHCMGFLTAICDAVDTFKIEPLAEGSYNFILTLTAGIGEPPCTPGIIIDDMDTLVITVTGTTVGIEDLQEGETEIHPNPVSQVLSLDHAPSDLDQIIVYAPDGRKVLTLNRQTTQIDVSSLSNGIYFLKLIYAEGEKTIKFIKE